MPASACSVTNFTRLTIDQGAAWSIAGNATGLGAIGTIAGFTFNDTIDLTGFVAVNETFNGGKLVLTDAGAKHTATLNIAGSFASGDFQITSDNIDGTDITIPQTASWTGASGDWNTAASWDTNAVPSGVDIAVIAAKGNITVGVAAGKSIPITDVIVGAAGDVLDVEGTLAPTGTVTVKAGHINLGSECHHQGRHDCRPDRLRDHRQWRHIRRRNHSGAIEYRDCWWSAGFCRRAQRVRNWRHGVGGHQPDHGR